ncbi:MAG: DUF2806 domain-containing protein [Negativicutes bacterium]|jgi:hypothetical protein
MEIKDLAGLSKPAKKLLDIIEKSGRGLLAPWQIRRIAKAEKDADLIKFDGEQRKFELALSTLNQFVDSESKMLVSYSGGQFQLSLNQVEKRALVRTIATEAERQANIENITLLAFNNLNNKSEVSDEPVDKDWVNRFYDTVKDISDDAFQLIWSKILAGEVEKPGSFSFRTIDTMKNLSQTDATLFFELSKYIFEIEDTAIIPNTGDDDYTNNDYKYNSILVLADAGLILSGEHKDLSTSANIIINGQFAIVWERNEASPERTIGGFPLTRAGIELLNILERRPADKIFIEKVFKIHAASGDKVIYYDKYSVSEGNYLIDFDKGINIDF